MIVVAHQPQFLPWGGFWSKLSKSDLLILMPNVQWDKGQVSNRVKILGSWVTLPVFVPENRILMDVTYDTRHISKIVRTLEQSLLSRKFRYGERLQGVLEVLRTTGVDQNNLTTLNTHLIRHISELLGMSAEIVVDTRPLVGNTTTARLRDFILRNCTNLDITYLSGSGGRSYLEPMFGITTVYHEGSWEDCSIVQLIAQHEDVLGYLDSRVKI